MTRHVNGQAVARTDGENGAVSKCGRPEPPSIAVVVGGFPIASEEFITREVESLAKLGARITIVTARAAHGQRPPPPLEVCRPLSLRKYQFWRPILREVACRPEKCTALMRFALALGAGEGWRGRMRALRLALVAVSLADVVANKQPQIIHAHFASAPSTLGLLLARWIGCSFGFSVHARDLYAEQNNLALKVSLAAHVVTCSKAAANDLCGRLPEQLHARVHTIYHGLNLEAMRPCRADRCSKPVILAVGRFEAKKGFEYLIQACAILRDEGFAFQCEIVGSGSRIAVLQGLIRACRLQHLVQICGWLSQPDLASCYGRASVLAVSSVVADDGDRDNIPNTILEALAYGTPIVASDLPAIREVLGPARAAILVAPRDARSLATGLRQACSDMSLANGLTQRGRVLVAQSFESRSNARPLLELLTRGAGTLSA